MKKYIGLIGIFLISLILVYTVTANIVAPQVVKSNIKEVGLKAYTAGSDKELKNHLKEIKGKMTKEVYAQRFDLNNEYVNTWIYGKYGGYIIDSNVGNIVVNKSNNGYKAMAVITVKYYKPSNAQFYYVDTFTPVIYTNKWGKITGYND